MTELVAFLFGFYLLFNWQYLWNKFLTARDESRVVFGLVVFEGTLLYFWYVVLR